MPLVEIRMLRGRTPDEKKALLESVTRAVRDSIGAPLSSIRVWIHELAPEEYMVGGKLKVDEEKEKKRKGGQTPGVSPPAS